MKKILHLSKYFTPYVAGIEDVCLSVIQAMKGDCEQKVLCFNHEKGNISLKVSGVEVIRADTFGEFARQPISIAYFFLLKKYIQTFQPDIIHLHVPNPLICAYVMFVIPRRIELVVHWHSDIVVQPFIYTFFKPIEKWILKRAHKILITSPIYGEKSDPLRPFRDKFVVLPNIVFQNKMDIVQDDSKRIEQLKEKYNNKPLVFFMGRHVPYKGLEYLIKSEAYIESDCKILIAGSGPLTEKLKMMTSSERIEFIGRIPDNDIRIYMSAAVIFAFPSITKNEAFGVALAEAMYCRAVPVTFTIDGSGVNWVNLNGVTGIEVANKDYLAFAVAIDKLLCNDVLRQKYSDNARQRVLDMFTIPVIKPILKQLYRL